jgi:ATP-dependent protease La (LON) substrate-binding domain
MNTPLPLFPLQLVCYPNEKLNLHIFEPRYQQLVKDTLIMDSSFGIPTVIDGVLQDIGTEVRLLGVDETYEDGRMDIRTIGVGIFTLNDFENPLPDKLYAGGSVSPIITYPEESDFVHQAILLRLKELYTLLEVDIDLKLNNFLPLSYQVAHKIGFSISQEYQLLCTTHEAERQALVLEHLNKVVPILDEMDKAKERIKLNGHFKHLDSLNF